jgi:hypothetical protein
MSDTNSAYLALIYTYVLTENDLLGRALKDNVTANNARRQTAKNIILDNSYAFAFAG